MPVSINAIPSTAKSWALPITPSAAGITVGAGSVRFLAERVERLEIITGAPIGNLGP